MQNNRKLSSGDFYHFGRHSELLQQKRDTIKHFSIVYFIEFASINIKILRIYINTSIKGTFILGTIMFLNILNKDMQVVSFSHLRVKFT